RVLVRVRYQYRLRRFRGSAAHWEGVYAKGGNSGPGSYGPLAEFKANVLNDFVSHEHVVSVIEFGCGDGNQLELARYPRYLGLDVSKTALALCSERFANDRTKTFACYETGEGAQAKAELAVSLDVIFHLVEDETFDRYMHDLFDCATRFVILYTSDLDRWDSPPGSAEVRHRPVVRYIEEEFPKWKLSSKLDNPHPYRGPRTTGSFADFYFYERS
ncbi:MAG: hypothetical protein ACRDRT_13560, partial [Pseudonocardiaceae bacterium]